MAEPRRVLLVLHPGRPAAVRVARHVSAALRAAGIAVRMPKADAERVRLAGVEVWPADHVAGAGCELALVVGGDGTILRAAELARPAGLPLLGVNLGHVGFLAEAERDDVEVTVARIVDRDYRVEERMTVDVTVTRDGDVVRRSWALNEASLEKADRERMLEVVVEIDGRPLSRFGCDGMLVATPTGSTAYAFSAGGPVVWPEVAALLVVPLSAHALFARPLVVGPSSTVAVEVLEGPYGSGVLWCDGQRAEHLPPGARVEVSRSATPVRLARLHDAPFTDRLVEKFDLPVAGWRGRAPGWHDPAEPAGPED